MDDNTPTVKPIQDLVNELKVSTWNECVTPHLDGIRQWYNDAAWERSIVRYLKHVQERLIDELMKRGKTREDDEFLKGQIAMLREIIAFPEVIDRQIAAKTKALNQPKPTGDAGY